MERIISKLDYQRLKQRVEQAKTNTRISPVQIMKLLRSVDSATLLDPVKMPPNVVTMHSVVSLEYVDTGRKLISHILYQPEAAGDLTR